RLKQLLSDDEDKYLEQMAASEETTLERQAKIRERAKALKEKREAERLQIVEKKLEQQFREQCEELRSTLSKRQQDQISAERMEQLRIKEQQKMREIEDDKVYAKLWYADIEAKAKREEADTQRIMMGNKDQVEVLQQQMAALEAQKADEKRLMAEEAQLLREQQQLIKIEEQKMAEEKRRKQIEVQNMYARSIDLKKQKEAKELQEQMAFDLKILEQLLEESRNEAMEQTQRKKELREEDKRYREYLRQLKEQERQREIQLDKMCDMEVEKMWEKKVGQWRLEKQARQQLLQEVMQYRQRQLAEKLRANELRQEEARKDREDLLRRIDENRRFEEEESRKRSAKIKNYENDLLGQMAYNHQLRQEEMDEEVRTWHSQLDAEKEYQRKLEELRSTPYIEKMHPLRRAHYAQSASSVL
ncbi:hypothetical protein CAPTEDRAFT_143123, partial [Capitella teleta]